MAKKYLMDCTLRDGGYVNNWDFSDNCIKNIIFGLENAHLDLIELGIMGKNNQPFQGTKFNSFAAIEPLLNNRRSGIIYTVMLNYAEKDELMISGRNKQSPDGIRLAFFKNESQESL
jgi:4-hydroxy 2-oxovalerate aldolase